VRRGPVAKSKLAIRHDQRSRKRAASRQLLRRVGGSGLAPSVPLASELSLLPGSGAGLKVGLRLGVGVPEHQPGLPLTGHRPSRCHLVGPTLRGTPPNAFAFTPRFKPVPVVTWYPTPNKRGLSTLQPCFGCSSRNTAARAAASLRRLVYLQIAARLRLQHGNRDWVFPEASCSESAAA
jgi:hypothetical protein